MTKRIPDVSKSSAFPNSMVGVQTAVPAFIGYTEKAEMAGKPAFFRPVQISSLADYEATFGGAFNPVYRIVAATPQATGDFNVVNVDTGASEAYQLEPPLAVFILYQSLRLFYDNGGGSAYVVSVGSYAKSQSVNSDDLLSGLAAIKEQVGPTMLVVPEATRLASADEHQRVVRAMLAQSGELTDRISILDVYGGEAVSDQASLDQVTERFHEAVGDLSLSYGMAYFPFVKATVGESAEFDCTQLNLNAATLEAVKAQAEAIAVERNKALPPSGAMAGIYTAMDAERGVWNAPANVSLNVSDLTYKLNITQQEELNRPLDGKAINAIRQFTGRGSVVWGARTLDGNSNDYRYIQVRRTIIYIEQSIKNALNPFVFAPNDANTWVTVTAMISNFLQQVWSQGGLMGATASEAFTVECGLGSTMTGQDILEGYMIVQVTLSLIRPAEFIELTFKQKMEGVS
jgi:phage tail sheath protein FI